MDCTNIETMGLGDTTTVKPLSSIKTRVGKMDRIIENLSKYLDMLKEAVLSNVAVKTGSNIEQQIEVIIQSFMGLKCELISLHADCDASEIQGQTHLSQEHVEIDDAPAEVDDMTEMDDTTQSEILVSTVEIKEEVQNNHVELEKTVEIKKEPKYGLRRSPRKASDEKISPEILCVVCQETFVSVSDMSEHLKKHIEGKKHACKECSKVFYTAVDLDDHMKVHTEKNISCKICEKKFSKMSNLKGHMSRVHDDEDSFKCEICFIKFPRTEDLNKHMKFHQNIKERPFKCEECGKCFPKNIYLKIHMRVHTGERPFECSECGKRYLRKSHLTGHMATHKRTFKCQFCKSAFTDAASVKRHIIISHSEEVITTKAQNNKGVYEDNGSMVDSGQLTEQIGNNLEPFKCNECGKVFADAGNLKRHATRQHTVYVDRTFTCEICNKSYKNEILLASHKRLHRERFKCDQCDKVFPNQSKLKDHKLRHTGERPHTCNICGKSFYSSGHLTGHMFIHDGRKFPCEVCGNLYSTIPLLKRHSRMHMEKIPGQLTKPKICSFCGVGFTNKSALTQHTMRKHTGERPVHCPECPMRFLTNIELKKHTLVHTGEKPHQCDHCGMTFYRVTSLRRHVKIHTGEGLHQCEICDKTFPVCTELRNHMRTHTGEKLFQCEECGKSFFQSSHLKDHIASHNEDRKFKCLECGKEFKRNTRLKHHMRTHTGEGLSTCKDCGKTFVTDSQLARHIQRCHKDMAQGVEDGIPVSGIEDDIPVSGTESEVIEKVETSPSDGQVDRKIYSIVPSDPTDEIILFQYDD